MARTPRRAKGRWRALLVWVSLVALVMTGCASIPTSGPVERGAGLGRVPEVSVEVAPEPPLPGALPRTVVEGYLQAMANYQQGYAVARLFLASDVRDRWRPENGVAVYKDGYGVTSTPESAQLDAPLRGRIGPDGSFQHTSEQLVHDFGMIRDVDGEWRIGNPPDGLLVSSYLFENFYRSFNIYFYDPSWTTVVPDPIFLPEGNQTPTALLQALLRGPTDWLLPVVVTAIPAQTRLNVQSAFVDPNGVVEVSLNDTVGALAEEQRSRMAGQITWTLGQIEGVNGVRFLLNGAPYAVPEAVDGVVRIQAFSWMDPSPPQRAVPVFGATADGVVTVGESARGAELQPVAGPLGATPDVDSLAVSAPTDRIAVVTGGGSTLKVAPVGGTAPTTVVSGTGILRPQFVRSRELELWTVRDDPEGATGQVAQRIVGDRVHAVALPAFAGTRMTAFRISPDGTRVAAIRRTPEGVLQLGVARINRTLPETTIDGWRDVPLGSGFDPAPREIVDVGWLDPTALIVLAGRDARQPVRPYRVDVYAASLGEIGQPDNWQARTVASLPRAGGGRALVVGRNGTWRYESDYRWPLVTRSLVAAAYAG